LFCSVFLFIRTFVCFVSSSLAFIWSTVSVVLGVCCFFFPTRGVGGSVYENSTEQKRLVWFVGWVGLLVVVDTHHLRLYFFFSPPSDCNPPFFFTSIQQQQTLALASGFTAADTNEPCAHFLWASTGSCDAKGGNARELAKCAAEGNLEVAAAAVRARAAAAAAGRRETPLTTTTTITGAWKGRQVC
jgi:hypothetical protein